MEKMSLRTARDRISALPDCVLHHILSFLDMKEVIKTSKLSKRWQYVWTSVPTLNFCSYEAHINDIDYEEWIDGTHFCSYEAHNNAINFAERVNRTLLHYPNTCIEKFKIDFDMPRHLDFTCDADSWVQFAVEKNVRDLNLIFPHFSYTLPQFVFSSSSITTLSVWGCEVWPRVSVSLTSLKNLTIGRVEVNNDIIRTILSGSPMLEYLKVSECCGIRELDINSESLRELEIDYFSCRLTNGTLEISAPRLKLLRLYGPMFIRIQLLSVSSLLKVILNIALYMDDGDESLKIQCSYISDLLGSLGRAAEFELGLDRTPALVLLEAKAVNSPLLRLTCLKLEDYTAEEFVPGIISLLKSSPNGATSIVKTVRVPRLLQESEQLLDAQKNDRKSSPSVSENCEVPLL